MTDPVRTLDRVVQSLTLSVRRRQFHGSGFGYLDASDRAKQFAAPAGHAIIRVSDDGFPAQVVHTKDILGANRKTDLTPGATFLDQFVYSHR